MYRTPAVLALALALAGCADVEGLQNDGDMGTVHAPQSLWRDIRPDPPDPDQRPGTASVVPNLPTVPDLRLRGVNPVSVVRADVESATEQDGGTGRLVDPRAGRRMALCTQAVDGGPDCPVRPAVYHDLTGNGREELITALDLDGRLSELRVYTVQDDGRIARILSRRAVLEGVEVAAEHLAVREPTSNPAYFAVSDYVWDAKTRTMNLSQLTLDDCASLTGVPLGTGARRCTR
ncbi:hypothetical protein [Streptomyces sp. NRRL F-2664]|uniref:hypothetical protein n=1 Tax=Streptomyces sp. NRRL F-2664 TaxID=1463842 RepID=UPI0005BD9FFC|nr:hypothetical protein [Streptomyces sp. NRRL F-2664]